MMRHAGLVLFLGFILAIELPSFGQAIGDSTKSGNVKPKTVDVSGSSDTTVKKDTLLAKPKPYQPNPKKSGLYSALLPGLGQLNNHQYWKVPVVYAGLAVGGYFIIDNLNSYQSFRKAYIGRINNNNPTDEFVGIYSKDQLSQLQNDASKYLNLSVLFTSLGYALQVMDAITSAHLKNFDISRDLSMRFVPIAYPGGAGMGLVMNF